MSRQNDFHEAEECSSPTEPALAELIAGEFKELAPATPGKPKNTGKFPSETNVVAAGAPIKQAQTTAREANRDYPDALDVAIAFPTAPPSTEGFRDVLRIL